MVTTHLVLFSFFDGASVGDTPAPAPAPAARTGHGRPGAREPKRRLWSLKHEGKFHVFERFADLERKYLEIAELERRPAKRKKRKPPVIVIPVETVREARSQGITGLQNLADRRDMAALRRHAGVIEESVYREALQSAIERDRAARRRKQEEDEEELQEFFMFLRHL